MVWVTGQASQNSRFIFVSLEKNWRTDGEKVLFSLYEFKEIPRRSNAYSLRKSAKNTNFSDYHILFSYIIMLELV